MGSKIEMMTLGDVCYITDGAHAKVERQPSGVMYLTSKNIGDGQLKLDSFDFISDDCFTKLFTNTKRAQRRLQAGDVLMGIIGTFGNCYVYKNTDQFGISSSVAILRPDQNALLPDYLYYYISSASFKAIVEKYKGGSVQGYTNIATLKALPIPVPSIGMQKAIVENLIPLDNKITLNRQINQTLEQMAQTLFKSWFVDFDPVMDNALDAGNPIPDELQHRAEARKTVRESEDFKPLPDEVRQLFPDAFEESELGWVPKGWAVRKISDFGSVICGKTPSKKIPEYYGSDVPFLKIPDMHGNVFVVKTTDRLSSEGSNSQVKKLVPKDSISVSCIATVGLVSISTDPMHTNQQINSIVPSQPRFRDYLYFSMKEKRKQFHDLASGGSTTLNMNTGVFSRVSVLKPSDAILDMFQTRSSALLERIKLSSTENESLAALRDTLLPKLISGELCLDDVEAAVEQEIASA